ncbi:MAG: hypothetical protein N3E51_00595 [Candidatus Micrarchaeota archaeon]|nr:hypothetical protein [Candidatus Micrarchaeota archaeon]
MPVEKEFREAYFDYIGNYEKSINEIISACGSREAANRLLGELNRHYEKTDFELKRIKKEYWKEPEKHAAEKARVLAEARYEVAQIIERHVPHSADHVKELIIGASLAVAALMIPVTYAFSALSAAASVLSIGGSYYIGFKLLKNWKLIASKGHVSSMTERVPPSKLMKVIPRVKALPGKKS